MSENEFDELVNEIKELCFTAESDLYYSEECLQLDDVVDLLRDKLKIT